jgi:hypothetical protein
MPTIHGPLHTPSPESDEPTAGVVGQPEAQTPEEATLENPTLKRSPELLAVVRGESEIGLGATGDAVRRLHAALGMHEGQEVEQSTFGRATERAVLRYQAEHFQPDGVTGRVDAQTIAHLDRHVTDGIHEALVLRELPVGGDEALLRSRTLDHETVGREVQVDGEAVTVVDHRASALRNLESAGWDLLRSPGVLWGGVIPFIGTALSTSIEPAFKNDRTNSSAVQDGLSLIPGVGVLHALKDLGDAAVHGIMALFDSE